MKNGVISNGKTTTYYGDSAKAFIMHSLISSIGKNNLEKAIQVVKDQYTFFQEPLIKSLEDIGYSFEEKFLQKVRDDYKSHLKNLEVKNWQFMFNNKPAKTARKNYIHCVICNEMIFHSQRYRERNKDHKVVRAHDSCVVG